MSKMAVGKKRSADLADTKSSKKLRLQEKSAQATKDKSASKRRKADEEEQDEIADDDFFTGEQSDVEADTSALASSKPSGQSAHSNKDSVLNGTSSREAHQKQKQLALERKAAKPNADSIARTKKIWERLRVKSAVPKDEKDKLVNELFDIIHGRVKDFVFKHDSVRVIQCALKYATPAQKRQIAQELKGSYRELAESKYAKFLIAKMVVDDNEVRDMVVPEFYGHVKRLIRHPEASWIMDDIYRGLATKDQKARLLREWYGPEFVLDAQVGGKSKGSQASKAEVKVSGDLTDILKEHPEKRGPIMQHLREMTNQLVQKKTTGFTILHDALLQYFINTKPGSPEATEFLDMLRDDEEGDLFKNLAFTKSGSRLVCLALAYGTSKDRRTILKLFKTHVKLLSGDSNGHLVLLTAYEVIDDTVMSSKAIFPELLSKELGEEERTQELLGQSVHLTARIPILYLLSSEPPKWLLPDDDAAVLKEIKEIRANTSKKEPETRRTELVKTISQPLIDLVASQAAALAQSSFGAQFIVEVLLGATGEKQEALNAIAALATPETEEGKQFVVSPYAGRMFKSLVQGGRFDQKTRSIILADPPLKFHDLLFDQLRTDAQDEGIMSWAAGPNSFCIVAMLEASGFGHLSELEGILRKHRRRLENPVQDDKAAVAGSKILLEKIGGVDGKNQSEKKSKKSKGR